ncbi:MAG: hypothetical protein F4X47_01090 [Gammaproteobacteria bacterium]|nr:hypothetical protein [Gammaproteobacteria bacterium]MYC50895.1 hypothetical protein [Gammaproteobacteria bacterium]
MRALLLLGTLTACDEDGVLLTLEDPPAAPRALDAHYFAGVVTVTWTLAPGWSGETFRVYSRRITDRDYFLIAEVSSCAEGACEYRDANVAAGATYEYYVAAVGASGLETPSSHLVEVAVPMPDPPAVPVAVLATALDGSVFLTWSDDARAAEDFSHYRVYLEDGDAFLLGETDSEGFLDLRASNGETYNYFVSALDDQGHESGGSSMASATPRPDYHGELIYSYLDAPSSSGFRFPLNEQDGPIVHGDASNRHFRFEQDQAGWWLVPGPGAEIHNRVFATSQLKCGPGSDAGCIDVTVAPARDYTTQAVEALPATTYVLRYSGTEGHHYAAVRITSQGYLDDGAVMVFDWAHQLQAGNVGLERRGPAVLVRYGT